MLECSFSSFLVEFVAFLESSLSKYVLSFPSIPSSSATFWSSTFSFLLKKNRKSQAVMDDEKLEVGFGTRMQEGSGTVKR